MQRAFTCWNRTRRHWASRPRPIPTDPARALFHPSGIYPHHRFDKPRRDGLYSHRASDGECRINQTHNRLDESEPATAPWPDGPLRMRGNRTDNHSPRMRMGTSVKRSPWGVDSNQGWPDPQSGYRNQWERMASLTGRTLAGDTESSSRPSSRKVPVRARSAPSSPQMPHQMPARWAASTAI